jgi:hypothetical protein
VVEIVHDPEIPRIPSGVMQGRNDANLARQADQEDQDLSELARAPPDGAETDRFPRLVLFAPRVSDPRADCLKKKTAKIRMDAATAYDYIP